MIRRTLATCQNLIRATLLLGTLILPAASWAGPTDPTLLLTSALAIDGSSRLLVAHGTFPSDDLVQTAYPLQLLLRSLTNGTSYVRFDLPGGAFTGNEPALGDGLDAADVALLLATGSSEPFAGIVGLVPGRLDVRIPASFPGGAAELQLFVLEPGDTVPVLSNALTLQVP